MDQSYFLHNSSLFFFLFDSLASEISRFKSQHCCYKSGQVIAISLVDFQMFVSTGVSLGPVSAEKNLPILCQEAYNTAANMLAEKFQKRAKNISTIYVGFSLEIPSSPLLFIQ